MTKHHLFPLDSLSPGELRRVDLGGVGVVVVRTPEGDVHALRDRCSHRGAPLSKGIVEAKIVADAPGEYRLSGEYVVRCPWHAFEFDPTTGRCPAAPESVRVRSYDVMIEDGEIFIER